MLEVADIENLIVGNGLDVTFVYGTFEYAEISINRGYKTLNIPLVLDQKIPDLLKTESSRFCIIGLVADAERLSEIRKTRANTNQNGALEWSSYAIPQATTKNRFHPLWSGSETSNYGANGGETISGRLRSINQDKVIFGNLSETVNDAFTQVFRQQRLSDWTTLGSDESHWTGFWVTNNPSKKFSTWQN